MIRISLFCCWAISARCAAAFSLPLDLPNCLPCATRTGPSRDTWNDKWADRQHLPSLSWFSDLFLKIFDGIYNRPPCTAHRQEAEKLAVPPTGSLSWAGRLSRQRNIGVRGLGDPLENFTVEVGRSTSVDFWAINSFDTMSSRAGWQHCVQDLRVYIHIYMKGMLSWEVIKSSFMEKKTKRKVVDTALHWVNW